VRVEVGRTIVDRLRRCDALLGARRLLADRLHALVRPCHHLGKTVDLLSLETRLPPLNLRQMFVHRFNHAHNVARPPTGGGVCLVPIQLDVDIRGRALFLALGQTVATAACRCVRRSLCCSSIRAT
jgi:hypothetical protein